MTEDKTSQGPWWHGGAGLPDVDALLGPEGAAAVGDVADEALKLFMLLRERFAPGEGGEPAASEAVPGSPWQALLGQVAQGALRTVQEMAVGTAAGFPGSASMSADPAATEGVHLVAPGDGAACSYCPVCQAIALFRSVPMSTWQRLATSVIDVADAARDFAGPRGQDAAQVVTVEPIAPAAGATATVEDFLRSVSQDTGRGSPGAASGGTK